MTVLPGEPVVAAPGRVLAISVFAPAALAQILESVRSGTRPAGTQVLIGSYGINAAVAAQISGIGARYAPMFGVQPQTSEAARAGRQLPSEQAALLPADRDGPIPADPTYPVLPAGDERAWGVELGQRFRDQLRVARAHGVVVPSWQFDEILGECHYSAEPNRWRVFIGGVLNGLAYGRLELHDAHEQGLIWAAWTALTALPTMPITAGLRQFWQDLDAAALMLVGEEYPAFDGDAAHAAQTYSAPHHALISSSGQIRRSLGGRYMVGMTPGWKTGGGLGGNIRNRPLAWVSNWRAQFLAHRSTLARPAGYAQFYFEQENSEPDRVSDAIAALHHALNLPAAAAAAP